MGGNRLLAEARRYHAGDAKAPEVTKASAPASQPAEAEAGPPVPEPHPAPPLAVAQPRQPRAPKLKGIAANPDAPPAAQAVSLALGVLRAAEARYWSDLGPELENWPPSLKLSSEQLALLREHSYLLGLVAFGRPKTGERTVSVAVCPVCGAFELTTGTTWQKCRLTRGCEGEPVKASVAKHAPAP